MIFFEKNACNYKKYSIQEYRKVNEQRSLLCFFEYFLLGRRQVVRHRLLVPTFVGSNPAAPATTKISHLLRWLFSFVCKAFRLVRVSQIKNSLSPPFTRTSYIEFSYFSNIYAISSPKYAIT